MQKLSTTIIALLRGFTWLHHEKQMLISVTCTMQKKCFILHSLSIYSHPANLFKSQWLFLFDRSQGVFTMILNIWFYVTVNWILFWWTMICCLVKSTKVIKIKSFCDLSKRNINREFIIESQRGETPCDIIMTLFSDYSQFKSHTDISLHRNDG